MPDIIRALCAALLFLAPIAAADPDGPPPIPALLGMPLDAASAAGPNLLPARVGEFAQPAAWRCDCMNMSLVTVSGPGITSKGWNAGAGGPQTHNFLTPGLNVRTEHLLPPHNKPGKCWDPLGGDNCTQPANGCHFSVNVYVDIPAGYGIDDDLDGTADMTGPGTRSMNFGFPTEEWRPCGWAGTPNHAVDVLDASGNVVLSVWVHLLCESCPAPVIG